MILLFVGSLAAAYLLGSIPTGLWLGQRLRGIDIRQHGSGNLGATNVFRVLGKGPGAFTLAVDILKGAVPVIAARLWMPQSPALALGVGLAAILGHTLSLFVRFRGGKGVATAAGVFLSLMPVPGAIAIAVFALCLWISKIVSISSILASLALAVSAWQLVPVRPFAWAAAGVALLIIFRHRANLVRLREGREPRITDRPAGKPA